MSLRKSLIRLAYQNPELRGDLLPLLKHADDFVSALDSETIRTIKRSLGNALKALRGAEKPYPDIERGLQELDRLVNSSAGNPRKEKVFFDKVVDLQDLAERHYNSSYDSALASPYSKSVASSLEYISGFSIDEEGDTFRHLMANYDTGYVDPEGWEPGMVMDLEFSPGEGSAMPPARDMKGDPMSDEEVVSRVARLDSRVLRKFKPGSWFHKFFSEKDIPYRVFDVTDSQGLTHDIPNEVVIEHIAGASKREQEQIKQVLIKIDFHNGDVNHFLEHLAKALAENYSGSMRSASASVQSVKSALGRLAPYFSVHQSTLGGVAVGYNSEGAFAGPGAWTKAWKALQGAGFQLRQTKERVHPFKTIMLVN